MTWKATKCLAGINMADFALDIQKFADSFEDGAEQAVRGTTIKLFSAIIQSTPVDEGRARGNWFTAGQEPSKKINNSAADLSGSNAINQVNSKVKSIKDFSTFTLTNNLPYIEKLEFGGYGDGPKTTGGSSKQAPAGMVKINVMRFNRLLNEEARKYLPK